MGKDTFHIISNLEITIVLALVKLVQCPCKDLEVIYATSKLFCLFQWLIAIYSEKLTGFAPAQNQSLGKNSAGLLLPYARTCLRTTAQSNNCFPM